MRKILYVLIGLILQTTSAEAVRLTPEEHQLRDSAFEACRSMTKADDKINHLRNVFFENIKKEWAVELLDSALALSISNKDIRTELNIRTDYFRHYKFSANLPKMEFYLNEIRTASYKYETYEYYFQLWSDILQFYDIRGDTEYTRMEAIKMEKEALKVKSEEGRVFAKISMARSLAASKKEEEAIRVFREALESQAIRPHTRALIHGAIAIAYQQIGKNQETIKELQVQKSVFQQIISHNPEKALLLRENLLEIELFFCLAYDGLNETDHLLEHLKEAQKYYTPTCFFSNYVNYHAYWGSYYRLIQQWEDCFREFDIALAHFKGSLPLHEMSIMRMKGKALSEAGRYEDAAHLYKRLSVKGDSLNRDVMKLHQETLQANYNIRKALLDEENMEIQYNCITVGLVALLAIIVLYMSIHIRKTHRVLQHSEREIRQAQETVDAANKMKEVFLHNIIHQVREPLNVVVGFSEILATEKDLTLEQTQDYSASIKQNASILLQLIIDVLDLSRLESGMMKFNVTECDVVQLCKDAQMAVKMQEDNKVQLTFETNLDTLTIRTDSERFMKMLLTVLSAPKDFESPIEVKYSLSHEKHQLKIVVENSPLLKHRDSIWRIKHNINQLFLEHFKGSYQYPNETNEGNIIITYPSSAN